MAVNHASGSILAPPDMHHSAGAVEAPPEIACPHCSSPLTLHQPSQSEPERLLGVCEGCDRWYLVDAVPDESGGMPEGRPGGEVVRELSHPDPAGGISLMGAEPAPGRGRPGRRKGM